MIDGTGVKLLEPPDSKHLLYLGVIGVPQVNHRSNLQEAGHVFNNLVIAGVVT